MHGRSIDRESLATDDALATARWEGQREINWEAASPLRDGGDSRIRTIKRYTRSSPIPIRVPLCEMWDDADIDEEVPAVAAAAEEVPAESAAAEAAPTEAETPAPEAPVLGYEPKKLICQHWIRPRSNQYRYICDYRTNYYNDVITYLDRRNQGLPVEKPRAQTWGERALRTYLANSPNRFADRASNRDALLLKHISTGARFHRYHTKSLISRKYSRLGFNIVSV